MRKFVPAITLIVFATLTLGAIPNSRSEESSAVAAVARNYLDAYYTADAARMLKVLHPEFHKRTIKTVNGRMEITEDTVQSMVQGVRLGSGKNIPQNERIREIQVLDIYKDAASVKVVTGRWIDYMHLSRFNSEWRVLDVVLQYTRK
jgi:Putative lumazine-binding